jgi:parallel beta-helix repeat protein
MITRCQRLTLSVVLILGAAGGRAWGGDLNPPVGPVGPTMKTLTEVEPRIVVNATNTPGDFNCVFKITQSGSYYLAGNVTSVGGKSGIKIEADNVTLDLNGYAVLGDGSAAKGITIDLAGAGRNLALLNGTIRGWGLAGVEVSFAENARLDGLRASNNGFNGLTAGQNALVTNCTALENDGNGIVVANRGSVIGCTAGFNGSNGIVTGLGSTISNCTSSSNDGDGIEVSSDCRVVSNTCYSNGNGASDGAGIHATNSDNRIEGNHVSDNDRGIDCNPASGNLVIRNSASGNTTNYDIAAGNDAGPIGSAAAATSPWANLAF